MPESNSNDSASLLSQTDNTRQRLLEVASHSKEDWQLHLGRHEEQVSHQHKRGKSLSLHNLIPVTHHLWHPHKATDSKSGYHRWISGSSPRGGTAGIPPLSPNELSPALKPGNQEDENNIKDIQLKISNDANDLLSPESVNQRSSAGQDVVGSSHSTPLSSFKNDLTSINIKFSSPKDIQVAKKRENALFGIVLSALYGKLLVVMGIAFPMSEVISTYIPPSFYDGFYLYLYFGSIFFMICTYATVVRRKATKRVRTTIKRVRNHLASTSIGGQGENGNNGKRNVECPLDDSEGSSTESPIPTQEPTHGLRRRSCSMNDLGTRREMFNFGSPRRLRINFGSFYLRMGAVAFGIGSMIYSGLEFGQYFELEPDTKCHNFMIALTPSVRMIFTFMQMYFIFLNSKMTVSEARVGSQFGLMHMIGTNLCVWLNVLVQETRHEILHFYDPENGTIRYPSFQLGFNSHPISSTGADAMNKSSNDSVSEFGHGNGYSSSHYVQQFVQHARHKRGLKGPYSIYECRRSDIMGALVQNASPFLFPCTIEYSLICAAILYVMWKSMGRRLTSHFDGSNQGPQTRNFHAFSGSKRSPHHYSVDCARANKGLFLGILVLVMTIISLILFFVLIRRPGYQALAAMEVSATEMFLYTTSTVAVLVGMFQMRDLRHCHGRNIELDNILLIVAQTGSFIYNMFSLIGGYFTAKKHTVLVLLTALASLIQLMIQTLFILDASKRAATTNDQARKKPGREVVTFLLVTNLAMWAINTLEKSRADSHPLQLKFYGVWAWTIITHISMPLAIFYRFHSTVCLCEIWKRAYKIKTPPYR